MTYKGKRPSERAERRRRMISVVCGIISAVCIVGIIVMMWLTDKQLREIDEMLAEIEAMTGAPNETARFVGEEEQSRSGRMPGDEPGGGDGAHCDEPVERWVLR